MNSRFVVLFVACGVAFAICVPRLKETMEETPDQMRARVVAKDNPHLAPDPLIHPDINKQWIIQYNPTTKKYRAFWLWTHTALFGEYDTHEEAANHLNEVHLKNKAASDPWEPVKI